jgi:hypothetical protein
MPGMCIINMNALPLLKIYREFAACKTINKSEPDPTL